MTGDTRMAHAIADPAGGLETSQAVQSGPSLSEHRTTEILRRWRDAAHKIGVAEQEGMGAGTGGAPKAGIVATKAGRPCPEKGDRP